MLSYGNQSLWMKGNDWNELVFVALHASLSAERRLPGAILVPAPVAARMQQNVLHSLLQLFRGWVSRHV